MRRGWVIIAGLALAAPPLLAFEHVSARRMALQQLADAVATAGAIGLAQGEDPRVHALRVRHLRRAQLIEPPIIDHPPRDGRFAGRGEAVRVRLAALWRPPLFGRWFGKSVRLEASATAVALPFDGSGAHAVERVE